jgi:formate/nitrite transporter FocA (FNT family)
VCLAVWLSFAARTATDKILGVLWPVTAFVALGLEHSVANMFLFPAGLWAGSEAPLAGVAANLFWVTLGNILGGAGGVALAYRFAYGAMRG